MMLNTQHILTFLWAKFYSFEWLLFLRATLPYEIIEKLSFVPHPKGEIMARLLFYVEFFNPFHLL